MERRGNQISRFCTTYFDFFKFAVWTHLALSSSSEELFGGRKKEFVKGAAETLEEMVLPKLVSSWSVAEVLEWVQEEHPTQMATLHKAIIKHAISGRALLRLKEHHLVQLGVEAEEQQQALLQDLLLLRVHEELSELSQICSELFTE